MESNNNNGRKFEIKIAFDRNEVTKPRRRQFNEYKAIENHISNE